MTTLQTVRQQADKAKKISKHDAIAKLENLVQQPGMEDYIEDLAVLYKFFIPSAPTKPKTVQQWVAKAADVKLKDIRPYCAYVYSHDDTIVATNGHILFTAKQTLDPGYYDTKTGKLVYDADAFSYPNYQHLLPDTSTMTEVNIEDAEIVSAGGDVCYLINGSQFNKKHVDNALTCPTESEPRIFLSTPGKPMCVEYDDATALIMPVSK